MVAVAPPPLPLPLAPPVPPAPPLRVRSRTSSNSKYPASPINVIVLCTRGDKMPAKTAPSRCRSTGNSTRHLLESTYSRYISSHPFIHTYIHYNLLIHSYTHTLICSIRKPHINTKHFLSQTPLKKKKMIDLGLKRISALLKNQGRFPWQAIHVCACATSGRFVSIVPVQVLVVMVVATAADNQFRRLQERMEKRVISQTTEILLFSGGGS